MPCLVMVLTALTQPFWDPTTLVYGREEDSGLIFYRVLSYFSIIFFCTSWFTNLSAIFSFPSYVSSNINFFPFMFFVVVLFI